MIPSHGWESDVDLRVAPPGRPHATPFEDGLPRPPEAPTPSAPGSAPGSAPVAAPGTGAVPAANAEGAPAIGGASVPSGVAAAAAALPTTVAVATDTAAAPAAPPTGLEPTQAPTAASVPPVPPPRALGPTPWPAPRRPSGVAVGEDLLEKTTPDEVAMLTRQALLLSDDRDAATTAAALLAGLKKGALEEWLGLDGGGKGGAGARGAAHAREEGGVPRGLRDWLRSEAARVAMTAREAWRASNREIDLWSAKAAGGGRGGAGAMDDGRGSTGCISEKKPKLEGPSDVSLRAIAAANAAAAARPTFPYQPRPPEVVAVIKTDPSGSVFVGGELPGSALPPLPAAAADAAVQSNANANAGGASGSGRGPPPLGRAGSAASTQTTPSAEATPVSSAGVTPTGSFASLAAAATVNGHIAAGGIAASCGGKAVGAAAAGGAQNGGAQTAASPTEEERAAAERKNASVKAFGNKGSLSHLCGPVRADEVMPLHTELLLERCFWLPTEVSMLPKPPPPTPWISPSPLKLSEVVSGRGGRGGRGGGRGGRGGAGEEAGSSRCSVCVVQKKGRCGTDTAPMKCLRRGGGIDPFDAPAVEAVAPKPEPSVSGTKAAAGSGDATGGAAGEENKGNAAAPPPPPQRPSTPPAASTAAIALMKRKEREAAGEKDEDSDDEEMPEDEDVAAADEELESLMKALAAEPALRASAPGNEVDGEILALQYELLWQQQANRSVLANVLGRVAASADEEGEMYAVMEGQLAEAAQYMSKVREVRRMQKREKREADQRAALEKAAAAAAASSRVGAQRRDADGNVIAPAMGALDGLPPDIAAAAAAAAEKVAARERERERRAAAAAAAAPKPPRPGPLNYHRGGFVNVNAAPAAPRGGAGRGLGGGGGGGGGEMGAVPTAARSPGAPQLSLSSRSLPPNLGTSGSGACVTPEPARGVGAPPAHGMVAPPAVIVDTVHAAAAAEALPSASECAVCAGTAEVAFTRETLRCTRCALPTHPRCYGLHSAAAAGPDWLCWVCKEATEKGKANTPAVAAAAATALPGSVRPSSQEKIAMYRGVSCILCPIQLGAFKQTTDGRWCHVVCAQWMPEIVMTDADELQCVKGVQSVPRERSQQPCLACGQAAGVSMRCSYGHCQATFHPLCARQAGLHVRASDGTKSNYRAYCDKHSDAQRERDKAKGVPRAVVPPPPEMAPVTTSPVGAWGGPPSMVASGRPGASSTSPAGIANAEEASSIRRLRSDLQRARGLCKAMLRRETVKRGIALADAALAQAQLGKAAGMSGSEAVVGSGAGGRGVNTPGPSGVVPTAPKRARSGSTKKAASPASLQIGGRPGGSTPVEAGGGGGSGDVVMEGRWPKRARRSGGSGAVGAVSGASGASGGGDAGGDGDGQALTPLSRERIMNASEATATNSKLPPGWLYVPRNDAA